MSDDFSKMSAAELVGGYREGRFSPVEVVAASLDRAEALQDRLNAFVLIDREGARADARAASERWRLGTPKGRLDGVPATIKDLIRTEGWPCRYGSHTTGTAAMEEDAPVTARLRENGAILIGATTTPEYGWKGVTDGPLTGVTRNPWDESKTPGGSSGGAAVAAATGIAPLNVGTDGGGSIRIPAAFTGIFGLKPSFGLVPAYPASPFGTVSHVGPMTRTVRDAATMLSAITAADPRNWHPLPDSAQDYTNGLEDGIAGLKVAYSPSLGGHPVDPEIATLVAAAVDGFVELGAEVEEVDPPLPADLKRDFEMHWYAGAANLMRRFDEAQKAGMDPGLLEIAAEGARFALLDFLAAGDRRREFQLQMSLFHQDWDLLLTPAMPITAFEAGGEVPEGSDLSRWIDWTPFSYPYNMTGQPAAAVPCGLTSLRLPASLQIVGALYADGLVLRAAEAYQNLRPCDGPVVSGGAYQAR
jgi:aspartyl-tRNA(Asn)/glutamyl-tRNA(Gln) amidotransferase subunit A